MAKAEHAQVDYYSTGGFHVERTIVCRCGWRFTHYNAGVVKAEFKKHKAEAASPTPIPTAEETR